MAGSVAAGRHLWLNLRGEPFHRYGARSDRKSISARFKRALLTQNRHSHPRGLAYGTSSSSFILVWQLGTRCLSPATVRPFAAGGPRVWGHSRFSPCSVRTPCWPPVSPALHTPSTRTRTPRALLRGGGCRCSWFGPATHFSLGNIPPAPPRRGSTDGSNSASRLLFYSCSFPPS